MRCSLVNSQSQQSKVKTMAFTPPYSSDLTHLFAILMLLTPSFEYGLNLFPLWLGMLTDMIYCWSTMGLPSTIILDN